MAYEQPRSTQKPRPKTTPPASSANYFVIPDTERLAEYQREYNRWYQILGHYQINRFDVNYRQYTAYSDTRGTDTKISDPVAPELVERGVQKIFERPPKFYGMARGRTIPKEITSIMEGVAEYAWTDPEIVQSTGSMREKLKVGGRELLVTGNTGTEVYYNSDADAPDVRVIPIEDVVFDATTTLKKSTVYYIRQFVTMDYLDSMEEITKDGKVIKGRFRNLDRVRIQFGKDVPATVKQDPSAYLITRSGSQVAERPVAELLMISRWEGAHCCRIINWEVIIEEFDNDILEDDPLDFCMDIEVPKQPYAYGLLDFLNGLTHAKDMVINQVVDYGSKALNPPLFVDPSVAANPVNRQSLRNAYKLGGIVMANPTQVNHLPMPNLPTFGFDMMTYIQQRSESVTGLNAYVGGVPNAASDKTKGTFHGIQALINQAQSPIRDRQLNIEESLIEPITNKFLKYMAALMGKDQIKWIFVSGQSPRWVAVTKNFIQGKITLRDLVIAGLVSSVPDPLTGLSPAQELAIEMMTRQKDPNKEILFDIDWIIRVETGSMAEADSSEDVQNLQDWVNFRLQFRIPTDLKKVSEEMGLRMGIKDPSQYDLETQNTPPGQTPSSNVSTMPFIMPREVMNFKDLPPEGQMQMAANAGIELNPQSPQMPLNPSPEAIHPGGK